MNGNCRHPDAYVQYLAVYHGARDFFECHEIMEDYWIAQRGTRHEKCWLALIRIAVACYHARRGNWPGARKMMSTALKDMNPAMMDEIGLDGTLLQSMMQKAMASWSNDNEAAYADLDLPITDPVLRQAAMEVCRSCGWTWEMPSREASADVIHRHLTRDRSAVIEARQKAARQKQRGNGRDTT